MGKMVLKWTPGMDGLSQDIDAKLLAGASLTVAEALEHVGNLTHEMRESESLVKRLVARLQFLRSALKQPNALALYERAKLVARFGITIANVLRFLKKFSKKKVIQRIAASRLVREGVRRLHSSINIVFQDARLSDAPEMNAWKEYEAADVAEQRERLEELVSTKGAVVRDLSHAEVEEALVEIRLELERHSNPEEFMTLLQRAFTDPDATAKVTAVELEDWFVRRDDVELADTPFDTGSFGDVFKGKRGAEGAEVCVKLLFVDGPDAQKDFLKEARIWHKLSHTNVVAMLGGCHVGSPLFFISKLARAGNFVDYLYKAENKGKLWELFRQAAQGLSYLHSQRVVHANIKCSNLLVGDDGLAKLCDFGFSNIKMLSTGKTLKEQPSSARWKAPECLVEQGPSGKPSFASDVFSLGMSIIEAKIDNVPWGLMSDEEIIDAIGEGNGYPRPDGDIFTDREWELASGLTAFDPKQRWSLDRALEVMRELETLEEEKENAVTTPRNLDKLRVSTRVLPATEVVIGAATHRQPSVESKSNNRPSVRVKAQVRYDHEQPVPVLEADTLSKALRVSVDQRDAAIVAIYRSMEQMCLEKRENGQMLRLLVAALIDVTQSAANGELQRTTYVSSVLDEVYRQLLGMLQQHSFSTNIFCRIASNWHFLSEVESLRQRLATLDRLVYSAENESSDWSSSWDACLAIRDAQLHSQLEDARNLSEILPDQSAREEALTLLKFEVEQSASASTSALVLAAFEKVSTWCGSDEDVSVPRWFIPGYEVQYDEAMLEGEGTFGSVYIGVWRNDRRGSPGEKSVAVKVLLVHGLGGGYSHRSFVRSLDLWYAHQEHPNVLKLYGASHIGQRAFLVLENADQGDLLKFIAKRGVEGAERWQLLLQVAKGLAYLHENKVVHGHLRCANILVSGSGVVKIADFGFDGVRSAVHALGHFETPRTLPWTAPELLLSSDGTPSFESDVYAFGMCIIEAVTGDVPWGAMSDDEIVDGMFDKGRLPRPDGVFSDREWELIEGMAAFDPMERWSLDRALKMMNAFFLQHRPSFFKLPPIHIQTQTRSSSSINLPPPSTSNSKMVAERLIGLGLGLLLPGLGTTVFEVFNTLRDIASTVSGNRLKCAHVVERVKFLYSELARIQDANVLEGNAVLPELAKVINAFVLFMREYAGKHALSQYFARHDVDARILTFHSDIDMLFQMLNMVHVAVTAEWRVRFQENQERDRQSIEETLANTHLLLAEYRGRGLMEALMAVQFAIQNANGPNNTRQLTQADVALLQRTLIAMVAEANVALETLPPWYVPSDDVTFESESFAVGTFGSVHHGKWNGAAVVVKQLLLVSEQAEQSFLTEATIWHTLDHPHIVRLYGACHKSTPLFFVCDHAPYGNFVDFFGGETGTERVQQQLWQRFYEAALGLEYLHTQKRVVHGDLKCNNLLVGGDGKTKLCDFGFSFIRSESKALSKKAQTDAIRWKALECIEDGTHSERNPLFQSDVYALGMCIIEAAGGETPWKGYDDATIYDRLVGGHDHKRPDGCFTDDQWRVVSHMTAIKAVERLSLKDAVVELKRLADEEKEAVERSTTARHECPRCHFVTTGHVNFCSQCGVAFHKGYEY